MTSETAIGIDFGTTNSVCAVLAGADSSSDPEILENTEGDRLTPSVVYYTQDKEQNRPLIGQAAENKSREYPERVIRSVKRKMGDNETIEVDGEEHKVEDVAAQIIRKLRSDAADKLGVDRAELTDVVITTPAYWESDRNQAVMQAAEIAGFESVRTIKEPASAAIAYGNFEPGLDKTVGVYDLGGGTFDFALVDVQVGRTDDAGEEYNVIAQSGHPDLGGDDWDQRIVQWIADKFESETGVNPLVEHHSDMKKFAHKIREERIRKRARSAKERLSNRAKTEVDIRIPFLMELSGQSIDFDVTLTQTKFESLTDDLLEQTKEPVYTALDDADKTKHDVDEVILIGGSTRMPQVTELVKSIFQQEPKSRVNPDEAVAAGAAIKASREKNILLLEVTPLSLGIGISGDRFKRMIHRNERLPARATEVFTTSSEGATAVRIPIYQGERDIASENRHLKTLIIKGMTPGSRNSAHIEVTFEVRRNGLINVHAVENTRNKSVNVKIEDEHSLPDDYIDEKITEAREMEEMDRRRQKVIEAQNEAKKAITEGERLLNEFPHVFQEDEDKHVKKHITHVRQTRQDNTSTLGELRDATEDLNEWVLELGDRIRRTGARVNTGPKAGPDTEMDDVTGDDSSGMQTAGPGETILSGNQNTDFSSGESESPKDSEEQNGPGGGKTSIDDSFETTGTSRANETTGSSSSTHNSKPKPTTAEETQNDSDKSDVSDSDGSDDVFTGNSEPGGVNTMRGEEKDSQSDGVLDMNDDGQEARDRDHDYDDWSRDMGNSEADAEMGPKELDGSTDQDSNDSTDSDPLTTPNDSGTVESGDNVTTPDNGGSDLVDKSTDTSSPTEKTSTSENADSIGSETDDNSSEQSKSSSEKDQPSNTNDSTSASDTEPLTDLNDDSDAGNDKTEQEEDGDSDISSGESGEQLGIDDIDYC